MAEGESLEKEDGPAGASGGCQHFLLRVKRKGEDRKWRGTERWYQAAGLVLFHISWVRSSAEGMQGEAGQQSQREGLA